MADKLLDEPTPFKATDPLKLDWSPYTMPTLKEVEAARRAEMQDNRKAWNSVPQPQEQAKPPVWDFDKGNGTRVPHAADKATKIDVGGGLRLGLTFQSAEQTRTDAMGQMVMEAPPHKTTNGLGITGATLLIEKRF